ncbi:tetratricopeptide repeat protein [Qipengyuania sp. ASV99]|uniref:tetratricopeptide repeat protein n=1 Tax=Qipengyuania sp. ASV99 TaxID=3399681 RepID=UPI003A4C5B67
MRLDGWKSIAAHFGRDRTTVIRWSAERAMPVHRIPGGARGSVYALTEELDAWLSATETDDSAVSVEEVPKLQKRRPWSRLLDHYHIARPLVAILVAALLGFAVYAWSGFEPEKTPAIIPENAEAATLFVDARVDWANRKPETITRSITKLKRVVEIEPDFVPAYSALADCYLLAREFGSLTDVEAFGRAQSAVDTALRIDPNHYGALRARAFIAYWWDGDRAAAARDFQRSLAINDRSAQTLFWYANALIDNGDFEEGLRRFAEARLLEAASPAIAADLAWAQWSAGETARAKTALVELRSGNPTLATVPDYLGVIAIAEGDMVKFVAEMETLARLRRESGLVDDASALRKALEAGPATVSRMLVQQGEDEVLDGRRKTLVWPAFVASAAGDRAALVRLLNRAEARNEVWGSAGLRRDIAARWKNDREVADLLNRRGGASMIIGV